MTLLCLEREHRARVMPHPSRPVHILCPFDRRGDRAVQQEIRVPVIVDVTYNKHAPVKRGITRKGDNHKRIIRRRENTALGEGGGEEKGHLGLAGFSARQEKDHKVGAPVTVHISRGKRAALSQRVKHVDPWRVRPRHVGVDPHSNRLVPVVAPTHVRQAITRHIENGNRVRPTITRPCVVGLSHPPKRGIPRESRCPRKEPHLVDTGGRAPPVGARHNKVQNRVTVHVVEKDVGQRGRRPRKDLTIQSRDRGQCLKRQLVAKPGMVRVVRNPDLHLLRIPVINHHHHIGEGGRPRQRHRLNGNQAPRVRVNRACIENRCGVPYPVRSVASDVEKGMDAPGKRRTKGSHQIIAAYDATKRSDGHHEGSRPWELGKAIRPSPVGRPHDKSRRLDHACRAQKGRKLEHTFSRQSQ